ncbi:MAG: hypothetical protein GY804_04400 [Alphaproteobacteria bacterium]|nr:hypothetical protein [Alphaproteobacteria bacterium]
MKDICPKTVETEVLAFMKKAGDLAINMRSSAEHYTKEDGSIVTDVDLAITKIFKQDFGKYFTESGHILIDEESVDKTVNAKDVLATKPKYLWTLDPIDGTAQFANNLPIWGIGIGILKDLKPYMSFIFHPDIRELFIHNADKFYRTRNAFSNDEDKIFYPSVEPAKNSCKFIANNENKVGFDTTQGYAHWLNPGASVFLGPWIATGGLTGAFLPKITQSGAWDIAMGWSMLKHCKVNFLNAQTGKAVQTLNEIIDINWKINGDYIISTKEHFEGIKKSINYDKIKVKG